MKRANNSKGYTIIELLVALMISAILTTAAYSFYVTMHNQTLTQQEISDMQQTARNSLHELTQTMRKAGFKLDGHAPYNISGDSIYIFYSETQAVDTALYFLQDYADWELARIARVPQGGVAPKKLMKKINGDPAATYADLVTGIRFVATSPSAISVTIMTQVSHPDESFSKNLGVRTNQMTERVELRNVKS